MYIEIMDAVYEDMESLTNLDDCNTIRCGRHDKNCALQNVFKIFICNDRKNYKIFKMYVTLTYFYFRYSDQ